MISAVSVLQDCGKDCGIVVFFEEGCVMESKDKYSSETFQIYLLLGVLKNLPGICRHILSALFWAGFESDACSGVLYLGNTQNIISK